MTGGSDGVLASSLTVKVTEWVAVLAVDSPGFVG